MNLNKSQEIAVKSNDKNILILAGAGTGKTYTMIARICRLVNEGINPKSILALTFTNAAANEMRQRYVKLNISKVQPRFMTFHSFCYNVLLYDEDVRNKLQYEVCPRICSEEDERLIHNKVKSQLKIKLSQKQLQPNGKRTKKEDLEYNIFKKAVHNLLLNEGKITFDILSEEICNLFSIDDPSILKYKKLIKYLFVDEFQDTDPIQWKFVQSFKDANICLIGDALQAIYAFRGADDSIIRKIAYDDEWTKIKLGENYRSTSEICNFANKMSIYADDKYRIPLESPRAGVKVEEIHTDNIESCIGKIYSTTISFEGKSAILCRTNQEVQHLSMYFSSQGTKVNKSSRNKDAIHILNSVNSLNSNYFVDWIISQFNADIYSEFQRICNLYDLAPFDALKKYFSDVPFVKANLMISSKIITILNSKLEYSEKSREILDLLGYSDVPSIEHINGNSNIINKIIEIIQSDTESDIYIGTIHSSKGLEYDNVIIYNVGGPTFKLNTRDNLNLYYVAITRAKNILHVYEGDG